jgi:serine/threonine protein kinase
MTSQLETLMHTDDQVNDYFVLEALILSTRTADLYKAFDKSRGVHISLWVGKGSLGIKTGPVIKFLENMGKLQRIDPPISKILSFGVDSRGVPFCVFPSLDGYIITHGNIERVEAERRFMACLRMMEKVHSAGVVLSDICSSSFWTQRAGEMILIGVMGIDDDEFVDKKAAPTPDTVFYLAPEQIGDPASSTSASDVYAIGILGFKLFAGKFPQEFPEGSLLSDVTANPPVWGNQVFSTCLKVDPGERYSKAGSVLSAINQIRENATVAESMPTRINKDGGGLVANNNRGLRLSKPISSKEIQKVEPPKPPKPQNKLLLKGLLVVFAVFIASFAIFVVLFQQKTNKHHEIQDALNMHEKVLKTDDIQKKINEMSEGGIADKDKQAYFQKMVMSDDPIYHDVLIKAAKEAGTDEDRYLAETAILDRARRLGLRRSAEIVRPWLRSLKTGQLPEAYEAILRALDVTLPPEATNSSLRQAYTTYNRMILRLTAALALDTGKFDQYQEVLSQLVGDASKSKELGEHSLIAIILYSTELVSVFGDDAVQKRDQISDADVIWLLDVLAARNDINVRVIASLAMERKILSPIRQLFLTTIRDREDLPLEILNSLVKAAVGTITAPDISKFGNWFDRASEDILLAICADTPDQTSKLAAFDILAAKSFSSEPAASLIRWIRSNAWEKRGQYIEAIGILANSKYYTEEELDNAFKIFDPLIKDLKITSALLDSNDARLVKAAIMRYSKNIGLGRRLMLLTHPDKEIRIKAIKSLEGINDLAGLKMILDYYAKEKDPDVKKVYSDTFWVIKEKEDHVQH